MSRAYPSSSSSRTGAALIVALGVLSLVLLLATAFVLSMQTERMAVRNASEKTSARSYTDISVLDAAYYLEPETNLPFNYVSPHAYWHSDVNQDEQGQSVEWISPSSEDETDAYADYQKHREQLRNVLKKAYPDKEPKRFRPDICGLLAGSGNDDVEDETHIGETDFTVFPPSVTNYLPPSLVYQLSTNALPTRWEYITSVNENNTNDLRLTGRVSFFVADISGLADIRHATSNQLAMAFRDSGGSGAAPPSVVTATTPLDLAALLSGDSEAESMSPSLLNTFTTFSLDPDPWCLPLAPEGWKDAMFLGNPESPPVLTNKFDLACLTNSDAGIHRILDISPTYDDNDPRAWWRAEHLDDDLRDSLVAISNALFHTEPRFGRDNTASNRTARALFWNLLNDIDTDRYPQTDTDEPWLDDVGVEAVPLVSEFSLWADRPTDDTLSHLPYVDDCPACGELRKVNERESATNLAHHVSAELWHPFFNTNGIPKTTYLALHLWKTAYTNDIDGVLARLNDDFSTVTETLIAHWGTNVVRRTYRHPAWQKLDFPETATHTLQYGTNPALGAYAAAGILPEGDSPAFVPDLSRTYDVTFEVDTNAAALIVSTISSTAPLHLFDTLLDGPLSSLLDGEWSPLEYTITTNETDEADTSIDPVVEYTTRFTFLPADETLLDDLLAEFGYAADPTEDPPTEDTPAEDTPSEDTPAEDTPAEDTPAEDTPAEDPPAEDTPTEDPDGGSGAAPPVVVLPVTFIASTNAFGETTAVLATTPQSDATDRFSPFIPRLLRSDDATVTTTNVPSATEGGYTSTSTSYELAVWYEVVKNGPETHHGMESLLANSSDVSFSDESRVIEINDEDFIDRFACATNETFFFEFPCIHSAFDTNGTLIATHTVTNLLPIGVSAVTNVVYEQKPDSTMTYPIGEDFDWSVVATDFTSSNIVVDVLNTLHFSTQLYLEDDDPGDDSRRPSYAADIYPYDEAPGVGSEGARSAGRAEAASSPSEGPEGSDAESTPVVDGARETSPWLLETARLLSIAVDDPRFNGHTYEWYDVELTTPGDPPLRFPGEEDEESFSSVYPCFAGYPILHHDGLPASIGDIGYLGTDQPWETLDLFDSSGAKLLDLWCLGAPATNEDRRAFGRIHACTPFPGAAALLFADTLFGTNRLADAEESEASAGDAEAEPPSLDLFSDHPEALYLLTNAICTIGWTFSPQPTNYIGNSESDSPPSSSEGSGAESPTVWTIFPFAQWMDALTPHIFLQSGDVSEEAVDEDWRNSDLWNELKQATETQDYPGSDFPGRDLLEDLIRDLPDRVTFRQNLALAFIRSDSLAPNGRILASTWTVALLWRDAWTGRWFVVRSQELR